MFSLLRLSTGFLLTGLGVLTLAPGICDGLPGLLNPGRAALLAPVSRGARRASPSGTGSFLRFFAARSPASFAASSSSSLTRCRFLLEIPCFTAGIDAGTSFSLSDPRAATGEGKPPGMLAVGAMDCRTRRRLACPGEDPKPVGEVLPNRIV